MNHIKDIVVDIIKTSNPEQDWKSMIMQNWSSIIGTLSSRVFIERIYSNTIILAVTDSCWMQELHLLSEIIKEKINQTLSEPRIQVIRFKYATKKSITKTQKIIPQTYHFIPKPLNSKETAALSKIKDPELSQALMRFLQKCHHSC